MMGRHLCKNLDTASAVEGSPSGFSNGSLDGGKLNKRV